MATTVRISELESLPPSSTSKCHSWNLVVTRPDKKHEALISLSDPFNSDQEQLLHWYFERYALEDPYEVTKAELAREAIYSYGRNLSKQLATCGLIPKSGDLQLEIGLPAQGGASDAPPHGLSLHRIHWEVLEDISLWPKRFGLKRVVVCRTLSVPCPIIATEPGPMSKFNVLLVVSRPRGRQDIDHQLVSRFLVDICERISKSSSTVKVALTILRPPTWRAFEDHLLYDRSPGHYQLVNFDMHGEISNPDTNDAEAVLNFCKPTRNPLKTKKDSRPGKKIADVLVKSGVRAAIINSCDSANAAHGNTSSNLAELLVRAGIPFVVAMAYKVLDEAVEVFMASFYDLLLTKGLDLVEAVQVSRLAMLRAPSRRARFLVKVDLVDYIVPVFYQNLEATPLKVLANTPDKGFMERLLAKLSIRKEEPSSLSQEMLGRDIHILELELLLSIRKLILLYGQGGCGKTTLLKYCSWWWKISGWIKGTFFLDFTRFRGLKGPKFIFDEMLNDIRQDLQLDPEISTEDHIVSVLQERPFLLVLDSMEALITTAPFDRVFMDEQEETRLGKFLARVSQGRSIVILSSRHDTCELIGLSDPNGYCLTGLPMSAAMQLAERVAFGRHGKLPPDSLKHRENIDYLRRILILLEGNPEAIELVLPALGSCTPQALFVNLFYGTVKLDEAAQGRSRFLKTIKGACLMLEALFSESIIQPSYFSPFWNLMPKDLKYYFWFLFLPFDEVFREGSYARWFDQDFRNYVGMISDVRGYDEGFEQLAERLLQADVLSEATVIRPDGTKESWYHVHPIFTLFARTELPIREPSQYATNAFVRHQVLQRESFLDSAWETSAVIWDGEYQHPDHHTNSLALAFGYSLDANLLDEVNQHGMSMTDLVIRDSTSSFYQNSRLKELLIPLVTHHLLRLHMLMLFRENGIPEGYGLYYILSTACLLVKGNYPKTEDVLSIVEGALQVAEDWKSKSNEPLPPPVDMSCFELRVAQAELIRAMRGNYAAKSAYEKNLAIDPETDPEDGLYLAIRRVQLDNIMGWTDCASDYMLEDLEVNVQEVAIPQLKSLLGDYQGNLVGRFLEMSVPGLDELTIADTSPVFKHYGEVVKGFGSLAKTILSQPMKENFRGLLPDGLSTLEILNEFASSGAENFQDGMNAYEFMLRLLVGDQGGSRLVMPRMEKQTSETSTGWQNLVDIHMMLYHDAVNDEDWKKALRHIDEVWNLDHGKADYKTLSLHQIRYARCFNELGKAADAGRHALSAIKLARKTRNDTAERACLAAIGRFSSLDTFLSVGNVITESGLTIAERLKLRTLVQEAKEQLRQEEELDELMARGKKLQKGLQEMLTRYGDGASKLEE